MKKILFISPSFFEYYLDIIKAIKESFNCDVKWYSDRPSESFLNKTLLRMNRNFLKMKNEKYFQVIKKDCLVNKYDVVFVIFGQFLNKKYVRELKAILPNSKFIYYTWDSLKNYAVINDISDEFDEKYSFDLNDCAKYGFGFIPLFYCNEHTNDTVKYDALSIYTVKPGKMKNYKMVRSILPSNFKIYEHLYLQSRLIFLFYKLRYAEEFKGYRMKNFKYKKISRDEVNKLMNQSKIIIDCQMKNQNGLTMRTFETLHLSKKLITTNNSIKKYDFYNEDNILIVDDDLKEIPQEFINSSFNDKNDLGNYSIKKFVERIFETEVNEK